MLSIHGYVAAEPPLGMPDTGGQVVYVLELAKKLARLGYQVDIWTRRFEGQPQIEPVANDVRIIRIPCGGDEFIPKEYLCEKIPEWIKNAHTFITRHKLRYHFINSHYWDAGLAGQDLASWMKIPHLHTPHSLGIWKKKQMSADSTDSEAKMEATYNFSQRIRSEHILYRECDSLIATSPIQMDLFVKEYEVPEDKIHMIPPGYDDNRFYPIGEASRQALRQQMGIEPDTPLVASIGRLALNKGFDLLIDAFSIVAERDPKAQLRMAIGTQTESVTEDPLESELHQRIRSYELQQRVHISGSLEDEAMADFYRAADVFCLPSRYEPFGMTAIEAMACGTPSVITTQGGLYRTLTYGVDALYADATDKIDFGVSILKIIRYPEIRRRLSLQGAHKVRSLFTWTGIAQQLIRAVEQSYSSSAAHGRRLL